MNGYDATPAAAVRQVLGGRELPEAEARFYRELPEREAAARRFHEARGWIAPDGSLRPRTTMPDGSGGMVVVDHTEARAMAEAHRYGLDWIGPLSDADVAVILRRLRSAAAARAAADSAMDTGPGTPAWQEAQRRFHAAAANADGVLRGVPNG